MILTSPNVKLPESDAPTIDALFRRTAIRQPDALALCDPPDRAEIDGQQPRALSFTQTDNAVSALAAKLSQLQLGKDAVIAYQLANSVESVITLLAILRAGLIAAPLPVLWRKHDIVAALAASGATAIITAEKIGDMDHSALAMQAAAEHFPMRHVCVFSAMGKCADGVVALDDIFTNDSAMPPFVERAEPAAAHAALITFENDPDGIRAYARSHAQILAADFGISPKSLLTPIALSSFAGIALALVPWLKSGCRLVLHQPFDAKAYAAQRKQHRCDVAIVPGVTAAMLAQSKAITAEFGLETIVALWRSPEQWRAAERWSSPVRILDYLAVDELGLVPLPCDKHGGPRPLDLHSFDARDPIQLANRDGELFIGGPMTPQPWLMSGEMQTSNGDGMLQTSFRCQQMTGGVELRSHRPEVTQCGGYRLNVRDIAHAVATIDTQACVAALPHGLLGNRLAISAGHPATMKALRHTLTPLLASPEAA